MMLAEFLKGLALVIAVVAIITLVILGIKWLKDHIGKRLQEHRDHKVVFVRTESAVNEYIKDVNKATELSMDEFERMCEETPYVVVDMDEDGEFTDFEAIKPEKVEENLNKILEKENGVIVFKNEV